MPKPQPVLSCRLGPTAVVKLQGDSRAMVSGPVLPRLASIQSVMANPICPIGGIKPPRAPSPTELHGQGTIWLETRSACHMGHAATLHP